MALPMPDQAEFSALLQAMRGWGISFFGQQSVGQPTPARRVVDYH